MKKYTLPFIIGIIILATVIIFATINFGPITINILERTAHIDIAYEEMQGNVFRGFRIKRYTVKLSDADSIYGEIAEIQYQFNPFTFSLPNVLHINLIEPTVCTKKRTGTTEKRKFTFPRLHVGLRINLKDGKVFYRDEDLYSLEKISGFVFIDFIGTRVHIGTMDLSARSEQYPVDITAANIDATVTGTGVAIRSFDIKGSGIALNGEGMYTFSESRIVLAIKKAVIDLEKTGIHEGTIHFFGDVEYRNGQFVPKIQGTAHGLYPFDSLEFETTSSPDTIWVNIFNGALFDGSLFAQIKIMNLQEIEFETNFTATNVAHLLGHPTPLVIHGFLGYRANTFIGFVTSPRDYGVSIDSLCIYGSYMESQVFLDSLFVKERTKTLEMNGTFSPTTDLHITLDNFDIGRFSKYFQTTGRLTGTCHLRGDLRNPETMLITSALSGDNLAAGDIKIKKCSMHSNNFHINNEIKHLELVANGFSYKNRTIENIVVSINKHDFNIYARDNDDSITVVGTLDENWCGVISYLNIEYNSVETRNLKPIEFDIINKKSGDICLSFIDGTLTGHITPMTWHLSNGNLEKLGMLFDIKEELTGNLELAFDNDSLSIEARNINFIGLEDGSIHLAGIHGNNGIVVETLTIRDKKNQAVQANGFLSLEESRVHVTFGNVGIWVLHFLKNFMREPDGLMSGELTFHGNLESFSFSGGGMITNGSFEIDVIASEFDSVMSEVTFNGNRIIFQGAEGYVSPSRNEKLSNGTTREKVHATGVVILESRFTVKNFNFDFKFSDAPIQFPPLAFGVGSGNFSLGAKDGVTYYNGNIIVKEAVIPIEFGMKVESEKRGGDDNWTMNLKLQGERNVWLRNREANIEFGGELYIVKQNSPLYISGSFETRRGNFYWLNHILRITRGKVMFIPEEEIDPELEFWAELNTREAVKIVLHCYGSLLEPVFEFFTEPPGLYSEQDIITYLNLNITWQELESLRRDEYVGQILPHGLVSWLESDISRRIRTYTGLDYFRIETPFFESDEKVKLTVGKYISRNLFITYTYDITTFSNEFNVEYFIDDKNGIFIRKDEIGEYSLQYQYRIRF
ncbi:MAG: translocation/assembly module TamB domain-containing protein [candidate division WOR-3 bacterium]|nr:MAG: translocation/assembly module TamB domain-containing protein [candidate division WOR-3 bacterium]